MISIIIISDHSGFQLKESILTFLEQNYPQYDTLDLVKTYDKEDDYPEIAKLAYTEYNNLTKAKNKTEDIFIISVCGSGNGACVALNRFNEFRAINAYSLKQTSLARKHLNANAICLGGEIIAPLKAIELVKLFLNTKFDIAQRHLRRIGQLEKLR